MTRPILVFDDDCGFCTWCARYADARGSFEIVGFGELPIELQERLPADWEQCAHLVVDGTVYSCGAAIEEALARLGIGWRLVVGLFRLVPFRAQIREPLYRWGADRRDWWGKFVSR